jgi:PPE-repeat protein
MRRDATGALKPLLVVFGLTQLALGLFMAIAPGAFFDSIGPFGARNDHYLRDLATFYVALGVAGLVAARRPSWRVPVLALAAAEFVLHAINHLADIGKSDPGWNGPVDFALVAASAVLLAWMTRVAARDDRPR